MAVTVGGTNITFNDGSTQSSAFSFYTGTTATNNSYPIGSYILGGPYTAQTVNGSLSIWTPYGTGSTLQFFSGSNPGGGATTLGGTWRARGAISWQYNCSPTVYLGSMYQRVA